MKTTGGDADRIGEIVGGKYRIARLLAKGGMGVVYEAQHTVVRRRFAIKLLRRDLAERRDILTRFQREAQAAGALENDNVAAAVDFGITDDGRAYIVMELLVGQSLGVLLDRSGRLPISRAADIVSQACRGAGAAHAIGIVHRDLKPDNLFVTRRDDGTDLIKILDFGVAKLQAADDSSLATQTGMIVGTAAYMSPEQARGEKTIDGKTDVYALGAILYELLSQRKPHPGDSQNAILHHIATHPAVPLESVQEGLPPALLEAVARALASVPASRMPSVEGLAASLAPFARREVWPLPDPGEPDRSPGALASTALAGDVAPGVAPPPEPSGAGSTVDDRHPLPPAPQVAAPRPPRRPGAWPRLAIVGAAAVAALATVGVARRRVPPRLSDGSPRASELARSGSPVPPPGSAEVLHAAPPAQDADVGGRPGGQSVTADRPSGHLGPGARRPSRSSSRSATKSQVPASLDAAATRSAAPAFDPSNPYR